MDGFAPGLDLDLSAIPLGNKWGKALVKYPVSKSETGSSSVSGQGTFSGSLPTCTSSINLLTKLSIVSVAVISITVCVGLGMSPCSSTNSS